MRAVVAFILFALLSGFSAIAQTTNVYIPLLTPTNAWRYHAAGTDLGTAWRGTNYDDSAWSNGLAMFYNSTNALMGPTNTLLPLTNGSGQSITTYYFRTKFVLAPPYDASWALWMNATSHVDDGAVFYLNGTEVGRFNMPTGAVTYATLATNAVNDTNFLYVPLAAAPIVQGTNVFAVEVHQAVANDTDMAFGTSLHLFVSEPIFTITNQPQDVSVAAGSPAQFSIGFSRSNPAWQWFHDAVPIPGATNLTLTLPSVSVADAGIYRVVASNSTTRLYSRDAALLLNTNLPAGAGFDRIGTGGALTLNKPGAVMSGPATTNSTNGAWGACGSVFTPATNGAARDFSFVFFGRNHNGNGTNNAALTSFEDLTLELWVWTNGMSGFTNNPLTADVVLPLGNGPTNPATFGATTNWQNGQGFPTFRHTVDLRGANLRLDAGREYVFAPVFKKDDATKLVRLCQSPVAGTPDVYAGFQGVTGAVTTAGMALAKYATALNVDTPLSFTAAPAGQVFNLGGGGQLTADVGGSGASFQWLFNGAPVTGATSANFSLFNLQPSNVGAYSLLASNAYGSVTSVPVTVSGFQLSMDAQRRALMAIYGATSAAYSIEYQQSLTNPTWPPLTNFNLLTNPYLFLDLESSNATERYYRLRQGP